MDKLKLSWRSRRGRSIAGLRSARASGSRSTADCKSLPQEVEDCRGRVPAVQEHSLPACRRRKDRYYEFADFPPPVLLYELRFRSAWTSCQKTENAVGEHSKRPRARNLRRHRARATPGPLPDIARRPAGPDRARPRLRRQGLPRCSRAESALAQHIRHARSI